MPPVTAFPIFVPLLFSSVQDDGDSQIVKAKHTDTHSDDESIQKGTNYHVSAEDSQPNALHTVIPFSLRDHLSSDTLDSNVLFVFKRK